MGPNPNRSLERGQATVELALCLPFLVLVTAAVVEVGLIGADQLRMWHAAREAARVAVVDPDPAAAREAAERSRLAPLRISIEPDGPDRTQGAPLTVNLTHQPKGHLPLVGLLSGSIELRARATMRIEQP